MKHLIALTLFIPSMAFANLYSCTGAGFNIEVGARPFEMSVVGNGFNTRITKLSASATFDTTITGNSSNPTATLKLVIKDSSFANPGDSFKAILYVTTPTIIKEYNSMVCLRGND